MDEEGKHAQWLAATHELLDTFQTLTERMVTIARSKLSSADHIMLKQALETGERVTKAFNETVQGAPDDADLYDQLIASTERLREETRNAITIVDAIIAKQHAPNK